VYVENKDQPLQVSEGAKWPGLDLVEDAVDFLESYPLLPTHPWINEFRDFLRSPQESPRRSSREPSAKKK
jgi:hypothetical protein